MLSRRPFSALLAGVAILGLATTAWAILISLFTDTETFLARAKDIVIVEVTGKPSDVRTAPNGLIAVDVELTMTLKGSKTPGKTVLATIYPVEQGQKYLASSMGGSALGTDLLAVPQLSLVPLGGMDAKSLAGKGLKEQVLLVFQNRLSRVGEEQKRLADERRLLETALGQAK